MSKVPMKAEPSAKEEMKETILQTAARLFAEQGYHATSTRAIAEAVGIAQSTLWYYFRSKDLILIQMMRKAHTALLKGLERICDSQASPLDKLHLALEHHVNCLSEFSDVMTVIAVESRRLTGSYWEEAAQTRNRHVDILSHMVQAAIGSGDLRPMDRRLLSLAMMSLPNWIHQRVGAGDFSTQQLASFFWDLIYSGSRADTGSPGELHGAARTPAKGG